MYFSVREWMVKMEQEKLNKLKNYNEKTTLNGIMMQNIDDFDTKVELAVNVWPQINKENKINYLFGKGVGVELAIQGQVQNRKKHNYNFPYRSHSDFEIYNSNGYENTNDCKNFLYIFGSQEIYPKTSTKALKEIPVGYMDKTYETVIYNKKTYLIPELELLFLDKYMLQESTKRLDGCDAILLLKSYKLDIEKINSHFNKYIREPNLKEFNKKMDSAYEKQIIKLIKLYDIVKQTLKEEGQEQSIEKITEELNEYLNNFRNNAKTIQGVNLSICPVNVEFIEKNNNIDLTIKTKQQINNLITSARLNEEEKYNSILSDINKIYLEIHQNKKTYSN